MAEDCLWSMLAEMGEKCQACGKLVVGRPLPTCSVCLGFFHQGCLLDTKCTTCRQPPFSEDDDEEEEYFPPGFHQHYFNWWVRQCARLFLVTSIRSVAACVPPVSL